MAEAPEKVTSDDKPPAHRVTRLLRAAARGDTGSMDALILEVYEELRRIASRQMSDERKDHTLQTTALVHEAFLRLFGSRRAGDGDRPDLRDRHQFFHAAAAAMRRVLIDHARRRGRLKRGRGRRRLTSATLSDLVVSGDFEEIVAVDEAIARLEGKDARMGQLVRLRFFAGLGFDEIAEVLGVSQRTVMRDWEFARSWLFRALGGGPESEAESGPRR